MPDKYIVVGLIAVISAIVIGFTLWIETPVNGATTDSDTRLIPLNIPAFGGQQCTYFVFQGLPKATNNYTTYAIDCSNNQLVSSSYNASLVFNTLSTKCNINYGCLIHVKGYSNGTGYRAYNITKAILIPESGHFNVIGDGSEFTVLKIPSGFDNNMFEYSGNHNGIRSFFNHFSMFQMWGNNLGTNNRGFYINTTSGAMQDALFDNLFLRNFAKDDIYLGSLVSGVNNCWNNKFNDNTIELAGNAGMFITGGINCQDVKIVESKFLFNSIYGIFTDGDFGLYTNLWFYNNHEYGIKNNGGVGNVFSENRFYENGDTASNTYYDMWNLGNDNVINDNNFEGSDLTNKPKYGLVMDTFEHRNVVVSNHFSTSARTYGTATYNILNTQQDNNLFVNNVGANSIGKVTSPFFTATSGIGNTIIPTNGNSTLPRNATIATNTNTPIYITVTGGTTINIELQDNNGNVIQTGLTTLTEQEIPFQYKIKITWHTAPTVTVWFQ